MSTAIKYAAQLAHVREVSLLGTADLTYWTERLAPEELIPTALGGQAQILLIAADGRYMGLPFREVSLSVLVSTPTDEGAVTGAYLLHAFNSSRFLAWCERAFFATPYFYGDCRVVTTSPASVRVGLDGADVVEAKLRSSATPVRSGDEGWQGPVFLPGASRGRGRQGRMFFAKVQGATQVYPFQGEDLLTLRPAAGVPALQALCESKFAGREWSIRSDAQHAKSHTYGRKALASLWPIQPAVSGR